MPVKHYWRDLENNKMKKQIAGLLLVGIAGLEPAHIAYHAYQRLGVSRLRAIIIR